MLRFALWEEYLRVWKFHPPRGGLFSKVEIGILSVFRFHLNGYFSALLLVDFFHFSESRFFFNLEHGSTHSHFKYFTSHPLVCTIHTISGIWHLSKMLEEATSRCCV